MKKLLRFPASLKMAVVLLLLLAVILGMATYYESLFDARTAAHLIYGSTWFSVLLALLGVNVLCAALIRYPWKRHQAGFVMIHFGIIVILGGSFVTRIKGLEGFMSLGEGEESSTVTLDSPQLTWQLTRDGKPGEQQSRPAELRWKPPGEGHEVTIPLSDGLVAVVDRYIHNAEAMLSYRAQGGGDPPSGAALHLQLSAGKNAPLSEGRVIADEWLAASDPDRHEVSVGPATLRMLTAQTKEALERALHPPDQALDASDGLLVGNIDGTPILVAVHGNVGREVPIQGTSWRVRLDRYLPHAAVRNKELVNRSDQKVNPAVELTLLDGRGEAETRVLFMRFPEYSTSHHKRSADAQIRLVSDEPHKGSGIDFIAGPDGLLYARVHSSDGSSTSGPIEVGKISPTGWKMNLQFAVIEYLPHATLVREYRDARSARGKEGFPPAIRLRLKGTDNGDPRWLRQGEAVTLTCNGGRDQVRLRNELASLDVGFRVKLKKFEIGYDPGTKTAATYTSHVQVSDPRGGNQFDAVVTMNEPLQYGGLTFFQASYQQSEDGSTPVSVFQVARDPGIPIKYGGSILLVIGIAMYVFGGKPRNRSWRSSK